MERHLGAGEVKEAWRAVKGWYLLAEGRARRPSLQTLEKQTIGREELYARVPLTGDPLPINVKPTPVEDGVLGEGEIRARVKARLKNGPTGGASGIRAEDMRAWLRRIERGEETAEQASREGGDGAMATGVEGAGDQWRALVALVQAIWERGYVPEQMRWMVVVLIPKGGGNFRGIGLLEPIWKLIEAIMDERLNAIPLHDSLHGCRSGRGTGTAVIEAKLA